VNTEEIYRGSLVFVVFIAAPVLVVHFYPIPAVGMTGISYLRLWNIQLTVFSGDSA
jgi:hypothetical protein